jgi:hypothetical protein
LEGIVKKRNGQNQSGFNEQLCMQEKLKKLIKDGKLKKAMGVTGFIIPTVLDAGRWY